MERSEIVPGTPRPLVVAVDDDPEILRSLRRALRGEPYEILFTQDPRDVLQWICARSIDLVIADQRMPEMDGTDLLGVVQDYSPETACIILSGFPDTALIVEQSGLRIERLLSKPWDNDDLARSIRGILAERAKKGIQVSAPLAEMAPPPPASAPTEVVVDCAYRTAREVAQEILPVCSQAQATGEKRVIVLKNLNCLGDSVSRLLKGLARAVAWSHFPIELRDDSGCVAAFLSALTRGATARK